MQLYIVQISADRLPIVWVHLPVITVIIQSFQCYRKHTEIVKKGFTESLSKLNLKWTELFDRLDGLEKKVVQNLKMVDLSKERKEILAQVERMQGKITQIDPSMMQSLAADIARVEKILDQIEGKRIKAEKRSSEAEMRLLHKLVEQVKPNQVWQERHRSIFDFYSADFVQNLVDASSPQNQSMKLLSVD